MSTPKVARRQITPNPLQLTPAQRAALRKPVSEAEHAVNRFRCDVEFSAYRLRGRSPSTIEQYRRNLRQFLAFVDAVDRRRPEELATLPLAHVHLDAGRVLIHGKGAKDREVPLVPRLVAVLRAYLADVRPVLL